MMKLRLQALAIVVLISGSWHLAHADGLEQTHQTMPSANFSFMSDLHNFLKREDANRYADLFSSVVVSGGIHTTSVGLTLAPSNITAYLGGVYVTEDASITYPNNSTCWVIVHKDMSGNLGSFVRVPNSHYLYNCASSAQPTLPDSFSTLLMAVTTSGGSITAVTDLRVLQQSNGVDLCRYDSLDAAVTAIGSRLTFGLLGCSLPVLNNVSLPSTLFLLPTPSGRFSVPSGVSLTFADTNQIPLSALWPLFTGASTSPATFTAGGRIRPEWWGAGTLTSAAMNTTLLQRAIDSQTTVAGGFTWLLLQSGEYRHDGSLKTNSRNIGLLGEGSLATTLTLTTAAFARHGFYCTGTTQHIRAVGVQLKADPAQTSDYSQTAFRCDGDLLSGDAPTLSTNATVRGHDLICTGYNICLFADGGSSIKIKTARYTDITITGSGSGSNSAVNEGVNCLRALICSGSNISVYGNSQMDHALYALGNITVDFDHLYAQDTLNEAVKLITVPGSPGSPNPVSWSVTYSTFVNTGGSFATKVDQAHNLNMLDLSNTTIIGDGGRAGSDSASMYIEVADTSNVRHVNLAHLSAASLQRGVAIFAGSGTGAFGLINATDWTVYDWSLAAHDTYAIFTEQAVSSPTFGTLLYSGFFDGAAHGRSVFSVGTKAAFSFVQPLGVIEQNVAVSDIHPLVTRMGTSTGMVTMAGSLNCQTFAHLQAVTPTSTVETTLATYTLPAGALSINTSGVHIRAWGTTANTATVKTIRLYVGGVVVESNNITTSPQNVDWVIDTWIHRLSATDQSLMTRMDVGAVTQGVNVAYLAATLANSIVINLSGQNGTANANEIQLRGFCVDGFPN